MPPTMLFAIARASLCAAHVLSQLVGWTLSRLKAYEQRAYPARVKRHVVVPRTTGSSIMLVDESVLPARLLVAAWSLVFGLDDVDQDQEDDGSRRIATHDQLLHDVETYSGQRYAMRTRNGAVPVCLPGGQQAASVRAGSSSPRYMATLNGSLDATALINTYTHIADGVTVLDLVLLGASAGVVDAPALLARVLPSAELQLAVVDIDDFSERVLGTNDPCSGA